MKFVVICSVLAMAVARPQNIPQVPGIAEHQAALDRVLAAQGRDPAQIAAFRPFAGSHAAALAQHAQAEAAVKALAEQEAAVAATFQGTQSVVSDTGSIGPSGIVGASGNIGPSGLCGPSGCVAFG